MVAYWEVGRLKRPGRTSTAREHSPRPCLRLCEPRPHAAKNRNPRQKRAGSGGRALGRDLERNRAGR
ncbi:hypothetical protein SKAU_G00382460 [Synaphobranchus kaupii]|uniref:Uncharacterized protein n=1 Tax=Synaphobranchus kaupii TaxID=118154 RepID=A0A9Q1EDZ3_SYNKA|nr:hypothetical protein SKAU_G00382460 [Synaphobranchus kaupii]